MTSAEKLEAYCKVLENAKFYGLTNKQKKEWWENNRPNWNEKINRARHELEKPEKRTPCYPCVKRFRKVEIVKVGVGSGRKQVKYPNKIIPAKEFQRSLGDETIAGILFKFINTYGLHERVYIWGYEYIDGAMINKADFIWDYLVTKYGYKPFVCGTSLRGDSEVYWVKKVEHLDTKIKRHPGNLGEGGFTK